MSISLTESNFQKMKLNKTNAGEFLRFISKFALIMSVLVIVGSGLNYHSLKYSRSRGTGCQKGVLILGVPDSHVCCSSALHHHDWLCIAAFDSIEPILKSGWAFVLPLLPIALSIFTEKFLLKRSGQASIDSLAAFKRLFLYVGIIAFRTIVLYAIPLKLGEMLTIPAGLEAVNCWCPEFVSKRTCRMEFDFSDHVVLGIVQYIIPCMLELYYLLQRTSTSHNVNNHSVSNAAREETSKSIWYIMPIMTCFFLIAINCRMILFACMYFHTPAENLVALAITLICGFFPLYTRQFTALFMGMSNMDLK